VIDATGSMKPWIDQIKTKVSTIIQNVLSKYPGFDIRVSIVAYRDFDQGSHSFEIKPFSRDLKDIESFLHTIVAKGGDDGPEDVNGALQKVCQLDWKSFTRVIIHFADAPCHGTEFHNLEDKYSNPNSDLKWNELLSKLKKNGIYYNFLQLNGCTKKMTEKFEKMWQDLNMSSKLSVKQRSARFKIFPIEDLNRDPTCFINTMVGSIKESMKDSMLKNTADYMKEF